MKKLLLSFSVILSAAAVNAQVIVAGVSPQNIVANYAHTWADPAGGWGTPDFTIPGTFVEDTLQLADDGSTGLNAQGNPVSASGCNALAAGSLAGKIAVVFRGDGTTNTNNGACEFGLKAFNAQSAGAVAVIVINRLPNVVSSMGPGADGANVTIPVVMIDLNDGATLVNEMQNGPLVMFLGNKTGLFANDISISSGAALAPKGGMVHSLLAQNGTEFNFEIGANVKNPGSQPQASVSLNATVTDPSGQIVYNNTVSNLSLAAVDTTGIDVFPGGASSFPQFSLNSYPAGTYTLTYSAISNIVLGYTVSLLSGGEGYVSGNNFSTTGGTGAGLTMNITASPIIDSVLTLTNLTPGTNYLDSFGVLTTTNGSGAGLTLDITAETIGGALMIDTLSTGLNYIDSIGAPTSAIVGTGTGLTVGYTVINGSIDSLYIVNGGSGYQINDTIQILAGDSSATLVIDSVTVGQISNFSINNPGSGYSVGDSIHIDGGVNGSLIISSVGTSGGTINSIVVNNLGQGYTSGDVIQLTAGGNGAALVIDSIELLSDDYSDDNTVEFTFTVNDSLFSYSAIDTATNAMGASNFYRPSTNNQTYSVCTVVQDPNASRVAATGLYFAATTAAGVTLDGEEMALYLYTWDDQFTDLNDLNFPAGTDWILTEVASGFYYYPSDLQNDVVYGAFANPIILQDNVRYLACVQTVNTDLYLGHGGQNYTWNTDLYLQPMFPNESDGTRFATGFGSDLPSALGVALINKDNIGIVEATTVEGMAYPNPANDKVTISIEGEGVASLNVTDVTGKTVMTNSIDLVGGKSDVTIASLESGMYIFNVTIENGKTAQFNVVKK